MTKTAIPWSDDCLSCLCNLPHTMQDHLQAVERAYVELVEARFILKHEHHLWDDDEDLDVNFLDDCSC